MSTLTIRGLEPEVTEALKQVARQRGISVNRFVLTTLKDHLGLGQCKAEHHDLDQFFGTWSKDEHEQLVKSVRRQRRIDQELWK